MERVLCVQTYGTRWDVESATVEVKSAGSIRADFIERLAIEGSLQVQGIFLEQ